MAMVMAMAAHVEYVLPVPSIAQGRSVYYGSISGSRTVPNRQSKVEEHDVSAHLYGFWVLTLVRIESLAQDRACREMCRPPLRIAVRLSSVVIISIRAPATSLLDFSLVSYAAEELGS